jgi:hypothetical protein
MQHGFHYLSAQNEQEKCSHLGDLVIDGKGDFGETGYEEVRRMELAQDIRI